MSNGNIIWTYFRCFLYCSQLSSTSARGFKDTNIRHDYIKDSVTRRVYIRDTYDMGISIENAYINSVSDAKHSGIYSQFF